MWTFRAWRTENDPDKTPGFYISNFKLNALSFLSSKLPYLIRMVLFHSTHGKGWGLQTFSDLPRVKHLMIVKAEYKPRPPEPLSWPLALATSHLPHSKTGSHIIAYNIIILEKHSIIQPVCSLPFIRPRNGGWVCIGVDRNLSPATQSRVPSRSETSEMNSVLTLMESISTSTVCISERVGPQNTVEVSSPEGRCPRLQAGAGSRHKVTSHGVSLVSFVEGPLQAVLQGGREHSYYQLRDRVIDGTPCGQDTNDICVQGLCRVRSQIALSSLCCPAAKLMCSFLSTIAWPLVSVHYLQGSGSQSGVLRPAWAPSDSLFLCFICLIF